MTQTAPPKPSCRKRIVNLTIFGVVALIVIIYLLSRLDTSSRQAADIPTVIPSSTLRVETPSPADTPAPADTVTPMPPTATPAPISTPIPAYTDPVTLADVSGIGNTVTGNYTWPVCNKAVFYWRVASDPSGAASLILYLHKTSSDDIMSLANEYAFDRPGGIGGAAFLRLFGGEYYFSAENTDQNWSIHVECQDNVAPVGRDIDLQGDTVTVTPNYELPGCNKGVFHWSITPDTGGTASLIAHLVAADGAEYFPLINEAQFDRTQPVQGQAARRIAAGVYYLHISNVTGSWHIRFECQD